MGTLHEDRYTFLIISRSFLVRIGNVSDKFVENIKTRILFSITIFKNRDVFWDNVEKYREAWQATDDNMAHAYCKLDSFGYKHTFTIFNTYWFSNATIVARRPPHCYVTPTLPAFLFSGLPTRML
jgi:hypothetical protein